MVAQCIWSIGQFEERDSLVLKTAIYRIKSENMAKVNGYIFAVPFMGRNLYKQDSFGFKPFFPSP